MNATFDLASTNSRWHSCIPDTDAYDGPQQHWIAALLGRVPLIDAAGLANPDGIDGVSLRPVAVDNVGPLETTRCYMSLTGGTGTWTDLNGYGCDVAIRIRTSNASDVADWDNY